MTSRDLIIEGARQNNLRNVSLSLPQDRVVLITGVSGSGKSSLAFDTIFAEGQWRFIESLSTYARLFLEKIDRPDVDAIRNIRPAIALEQRNTTRGARPTVGTVTELYDCLRILYAAVAHPVCPSCGKTLIRWTPSAVAAHVLKEHVGARAIVAFETEPDRIEALRRQGYLRFRQDGVEVDQPESGLLEVVVDRLLVRDDDAPRLADSVETAWREGHDSIVVDLVDRQLRLRFSGNLGCPDCRIDVPRPEPNLFSFNHPLGACPDCNGFGNILDFDPDRIVPDKTLSLADGAIEPWYKPSGRRWYRTFLKDSTKAGIDIHAPFGDLPADQQHLIFEGRKGFYGIRDFFNEIETKRYKLHVRVFLSRYRKGHTCPSCHGARLRPEPLWFRLGGKTIVELAAMSLSDLSAQLEDVSLSGHEFEAAAEALRLIRTKIGFLRRVGLDYLTLSRPAKTLSGGEAQRISLSNQLSARLTGTLYVLDEPTVGLHARDTARIAEILREIARTGNSVIVVEHDRTMIESADHVVDMGPGGGSQGGNVLFSGPTAEFRAADTLTARYLRNEETVPLRPALRMEHPAASPTQWVRLLGASGNNLKSADLNIPLGTLTCVTGVSGSGKSSLVVDTLYPALARRLKSAFLPGLPFVGLGGAEAIKSVRLIDQTPIGRSPRSNPATYLNVFGVIRKVFASQPEAKKMGLTPGHFSFNVAGGRCETCQGDGFQKLEMYFFEDLYVTCDDCKGRRFKPEILYVTHLGKDVHQVLEMTIEEALAHFASEPAVVRRLAPLEEMGLGYLRLGQPAPTLSGGEAQRLKICAEIASGSSAGHLYILDEPTTGLHFDDIRKFLAMLNRLIGEGGTVLMIEHNLDVIRTADWVIDVGPEGGDGGGSIVAEGTPEAILTAPDSRTGRMLRTVT